MNERDFLFWVNGLLENRGNDACLDMIKKKAEEVIKNIKNNGTPFPIFPGGGGGITYTLATTNRSEY